MSGSRRFFGVAILLGLAALGTRGVRADESPEPPTALVEAFLRMADDLARRPMLDRSPTDVVDELLALDEESAFAALNAVWEGLRERGPLFFTSCVLDLAQIRYGREPNRPGFRILTLDGFRLIVNGGPSGGGHFPPPLGRLVDREGGLVSAPPRKPLELIGRLEARGSPGLDRVLADMWGRHSLATELGLAARRDPAVAERLAGFSLLVPRPSARAEVVDLALGASRTEIGRKRLRERIAAEARAIGKRGDDAGFVAVAPALEVAGESAAIVAALDRIASDRDRHVALELALKIGGNAGRGYVAAFAFADPTHVAWLGRLKPGGVPMPASDAAHQLDVLRGILSRLRDPGFPEVWRPELRKALDGFVVGRVAPDPVTLASELVAGVDAGTLRLDRYSSYQRGAFGPKPAVMIDPRTGEGDVKVRAERDGAKVRILVENPLSRPVHVNRYSMAGARIRVLPGRWVQVRLEPAFAFTVEVGPEWIEGIPPGETRTFEVRLPPDLGTDLPLRVDLFEECRTPSLGRDDTLLTRFSAWCR